MARPLIAGRGHRDLSLYRNFILNDHRWSSNTSKSAHKQKRTFAALPIPGFTPLKRVSNAPSRTWQTIKRADGSSTSIANDMRVDFCRSNVAMPKNFLDRPDIAPRSQ